MKKSAVLSFLFLLYCGFLSAQEGVKNFLYKGTVGKYPVTLFLKQDNSGCGPTFYYGMYKYDNVSNWLYLTISDDERNKLVMVEGEITGILSLKSAGETLKGYWISPEGDRKLNVSLKEVPTTNKMMKAYEERYEVLHYEMNDC